MNTWPFARSPAGILLLLNFGEERGLSASTLLAQTQLAHDQLADPNLPISALQELRVVGHLLRHLGHPPGLGLALGLRYRATTYGLYGHGLLCSETLAQALDRALRFIQLTFAFSHIEPLSLSAGTCTLRMRPPALSPGLSRFLLERDLAAAAALLRELAGPGFSLTRFCLQRGRGRAFRSPAVISRMAGAWPELSDEGDMLSFPATWLARRLPGANATSAAQCDELCTRLLTQRRTRVDTPAFVQQVLEGHGQPALPTLAKVAALAGLGERSLRRRLAAQGTNFRALRAATQATQAAALVSDPALDISAIAHRLGYADLSTFSEAFKRWHGLSPLHYRRSKAGAQVSPSQAA